MLNQVVGYLLVAAGVFGVLITIVLEFVRVPPQEKRTVTRPVMALIVLFLFVACIGGVILSDYYDKGILGGTPVSNKPTAPVQEATPAFSPSLSPEPSPTPGVQTPEPTETVLPDSQPPVFPATQPSPSPTPEAQPQTPAPAPPPQGTFLLSAFDDVFTNGNDIHLEYRGPNDQEFVLERFPLELPMVPGYYYVKIHRDGTCRELAQTSFYVDSSVAGYAVGFRRILKWGLYDAGEVDDNCLLCSWGYSALSNANLCLALVDGAQYSASGLEICIRCEDFDSDVFRCTYNNGPLWLSLPPGYNYSVTACLDSFVAAEGTFQPTAPQDGSAPEMLKLQLA